MLKLSVFAFAGAFLAGEAAASEEMAAATRAKADLTSLFSDKDYPAEAVAAREQGDVGFSLDVGQDGQVSGCAITRSSGSTALDDATCRMLMSRARFTPARDAGGAAVPDRIAGKIKWTMPPAAPAS